jgi:hypothetical protein
MRLSLMRDANAPVLCAETGAVRGLANLASRYLAVPNRLKERCIEPRAVYEDWVIRIMIEAANPPTKKLTLFTSKKDDP